MKKDEAKSLFTLAGFEVLAMKALIDGYGYEPDDERFTQRPPRCAWWFVKTQFGWIEIGWRKRVISIDWTDTTARRIVTNDDVTKTDTYVHAWSIADALKYLTELRSRFNTTITVHIDTMEQYQKELYGNPQLSR